MTTSRPDASLTRRTALAGLATVLALAVVALLGRPLLDTAAQEAPTTVGHPLVGTWVIDNDTSTDTGAPPVAVFTSDGTFTDAAAGFSGVWEATGPSSAVHTFVGVIDNPAGFSGYIVLRGPIEVDETGDAWTQTYSVMTVSADGTVVETSPPGEATGTRLQVVSEDGMGTALAEVPVWAPAPADDATPAP